MADFLTTETGEYLETEEGNYILADGVWSDMGTWDDTATWTDGGAIFGNVPILPKRTITLTRTDLAPRSWDAPFNPADEAPYVFDLGDFLGSGDGAESLDTLIGVSLDAVAVAMGVMIEAGNRTPKVDRTNKRLAIWLKVDAAFQGPSYFVSPVKARVIVTFTTADTPVAIYRRSGLLTIAQVL